jgi:hypothetical protein
MVLPGEVVACALVRSGGGSGDVVLPVGLKNTIT